MTAIGLAAFVAAAAALSSNDVTSLFFVPCQDVVVYLLALFTSGVSPSSASLIFLLSSRARLLLSRTSSSSSSLVPPPLTMEHCNNYFKYSSILYLFSSQMSEGQHLLFIIQKPLYIKIPSIFSPVFTTAHWVLACDQN